jgi:hypothetical protein
VAFLKHSRSSVFFAADSTKKSRGESAIPQLKRLTTDLDVAPWGEDNRFPQNIVSALEACGVAQSTLKWKASALWGGGIVYGKVVDIDANGNEVFQMAKPGEYPEVDKFWAENRIPRFFAEFALDFVYFANCFPELIMNKGRDKIMALVHQESCDCRFKQANDRGEIDTVYISKLWGATKDQFVKYKKDRGMAGLPADQKPKAVDGKYVIERKAIDPYFPLESLQALREKNQNETTFILPVNFPSPNKTYYQLPSWDGARVGGWIEIASRVPTVVKALYEKAFSIKYHIEIPEQYFVRRYGATQWDKMSTEERAKARSEILEAMDKYLAGDENAHKTFVSYFDYDNINKAEYGRIKINVIDNKLTTDKDLLTAGTANSEIMIAMGVNPNTLGAGKPGGVYASNQGGSNIREGKLEHDSSLTLERQLALEPFLLIKAFNKWPEDLQFRFRDNVLLTLDKGKQTETKIAT